MAAQQERIRREHDGVIFQTSPELVTTYPPMGISATVTVPANASTIITSGHVGAKKQGNIVPDVEEQVELAFKHVETSLKHAGASNGWDSVYHITTYHMAELMQEPKRTIFFKVKDKYIKKGNLVWTGIAVPRLYQGALLEITAYATLPPVKASL